MRYDEYTEHQKLTVELLCFDRSRIELLASDHEIGDAARDGFLMRTEVALLGLDSDTVKLTANKLLTEHAHLIDKVAAMKIEIEQQR